jgi:signal recognition particle GTPase
MSLVISSTTDDQAAVNAAAGIEAPVEPETTEQIQPPGEEPQPAKPPGEPDEDEEEGDEPDEEEDKQPEQPPQQPKKKGGFQRKIEALQRENGYFRRQLEEVLAGTRMGIPRIADQFANTGVSPRPAVEQPQQPLEPPRQDQFESYEDFTRALTRYEVALARDEEQAKFRQWQAQEQQRQVAQSWQERVGSFKQQAPDFDDVLAATDHIQLHPAMQQMLMQSKVGPQLAYALAQDPETLEEIAQLDPMEARYELRRMERELRRAKPPQQQKPTPQISKAPQPIVPVAKGANGNGPRTLDDAQDYQQYKAMREAQIAARRKAGRRAA